MKRDLQFHPKIRGANQYGWRTRRKNSICDDITKGDNPMAGVQVVGKHLMVGKIVENGGCADFKGGGV